MSLAQDVARDCPNLTLAQALVLVEIEKHVLIRTWRLPQTRSMHLRLFVGPQDVHHTSWFDVSPEGGIDAVTRGRGIRSAYETTLEELPVVVSRLLAWL